MKVLMIQGSPRINGNTAQIEKILLQLFQKDYEAECDIITLSTEKITPCFGCRVCFNQSEEMCPGKGTVLSLKEQMTRADAIVIGSPVYVEDVSGIMKTWLDRMAFNCHRPFLMGKPIYIFTTSGEGASSHSRNTMKNALTSWGGQIIACDNFSMGSKMDKEVAEKKFTGILHSRVNTLYSYVLKSRITVFSLIAFRLQKKNRIRRGESSVTDYQYWKSRNWLEKDTFYYLPVKCSRIKRTTANVLAWMIGLFLL